MATGDNPVTPYLEEGDRVPCVAGTGGNVTGGRFVVVSADQQPGWAGLTTSTAGGRTVVARAGAGAKAFGLASQDSADGDALTVYREGAHPMTSGAGITAGQEVMSDSTGRAVPWVSAASEANKACGYAMSTVGGANLPVLVMLYN